MYTKGDKVRVMHVKGFTVLKAPSVPVVLGDILTVIEEVPQATVVAFEAKGLSVTIGSITFNDAQCIPINQIEPSPTTPPFIKGDRAKYKGKGVFFTTALSPDGSRPIANGDIVEVLQCGQIPATKQNAFRWIVCYLCPSYSCHPAYLSGSVVDAQCVWAEALELEASTNNQVVADHPAQVCSCSRTTLLRYGCTCGSIKKYKVSM